LLRDMERYRQKIAAAASLFEGWLATITAPLPVGFVPPCLPTKARDRPRDDLWLHEIKHDGFRVIARKNGAQWAAKGTAAALVRAASSGWESASGILFMADCLHFHRPDGSRHPYNSGAPAVLVAFGQYDLVRLRQINIAGTLVVQWQRLGQRREDLLDWRASARPRSKEPTPTSTGRAHSDETEKRVLRTFPDDDYRGRRAHLRVRDCFQSDCGGC
jgi:hypothetical protein